MPPAVGNIFLRLRLAYGHGKHILKQQTPLWLAQHPHVMAFISTKRVRRRRAALLVLD
ncbi:hypothetical protein KCP69_10910 [Salmonella enterica subsp. enterica]|nr:hypothetical protein KCP69_10910 [Salmonella enterica subsp. enterica]